MNYIGEYQINQFLSIAVQAHDTSGSASDLDSGSFSIDFYENDLSNSGGFNAMTTPDTTFNTKLDSKTGLYSLEIQLTAANGFEVGKSYMARVGEGTIDSQTPAMLFYFKVTSGVYDANITKINGNTQLNSANIDDVFEEMHQASVGDFTADDNARTKVYDSFTHTYDANNSRTKS